MEFFSKNNQNNHVSSNKSYDFLGICDPPDVEPDDISEANSKSYFAIGVVEDKENTEICPTTNAADENFEARAETGQEVVFFVKLHIYWLENVMNFMGTSQKNTFFRVSVLQPKALHSYYFILKVPFFLQFFGRP